MLVNLRQHCSGASAGFNNEVVIVKIYVCVGSSCHLRGSYEIVSLLKQKLAENKLEDEINLGAAFCLGKCTEGVTMKFNDEVVGGVTKDNFDEVFNEYVLSRTV